MTRDIEPVALGEPDVPQVLLRPPTIGHLGVRPNGRYVQADDVPTLDESDLGEAAPNPVPAFDSIDLELSVESATPPLRPEPGGW
jgi:hypothetical protein